MQLYPINYQNMPLKYALKKNVSVSNIIFYFLLNDLFFYILYYNTSIANDLQKCVVFSSSESQTKMFNVINNIIINK